MYALSHECVYSCHPDDTGNLVTELLSSNGQLLLFNIIRLLGGTPQYHCNAYCLLANQVRWGEGEVEI
jgi:hypothetical protein